MIANIGIEYNTKRRSLLTEFKIIFNSPKSRNASLCDVSRCSPCPILRRREIFLTLLWYMVHLQILKSVWKRKWNFYVKCSSFRDLKTYSCMKRCPVFLRIRFISRKTQVRSFESYKTSDHLLPSHQHYFILKEFYAKRK